MSSGSDGHESTSASRLFHYFSIIGLKPDGGLQPQESNVSPSQVLEEAPLVPPLTRSYKSYVLGFYPDYVPSTPFDQDAVQMLSLPKGLQLRTQKHNLEPHFHPFVITREDGSQYYGFTYTFYEEVNSKQICTTLYGLQSAYLTNVSCTQGKPNTGTTVDPHNTHSLPRQIRLCSSQAADAKNFYDITKDQLFVSKCITLVGPHPSVMASWKFLTELYRIFTECDTDTITLESYVYNLLYEVPAPPRGKCLSFTCIRKELICQRPPCNELPLFEYSLQEFFALLGVDTVMQLLCCVLLENQIIILSSDYYRLMLVAESICTLIFPFLWQNVYVPILPSSLLHFLDAPVPFIMGIQAEVENDIIRIPNEANLCLLDIDRGSIEVPEDLPQLPNKTEIHKELLQYFDKYTVSASTKFDRNSNEQLIDYKYRRRRKPSRSHESETESPSNTNILVRRDSSSSGYSSHSPLDSLQYGSDSTRPFHQGVRASSLPKAKGTRSLDGKQETFSSSVLYKSLKGPETKLLQNLPKKDDSDWVVEELKFNNAVREIFLNWFVQMFCSYENFITLPNLQDEDMEQWLNVREALHTFDKATFLVDQPDGHLPFLSRFIESQLFTSLIDQKILSGDKNINIKIFDLRIRLLRDKYDGSVVRTATYEPCSTTEETEQILMKRLTNIDYKAPPPQAIDPQTESCTHFNPGQFPLLDKTVLNREPVKSKRRSARAWHRRERQAQHLEQIAFSPDQREKVLQEARLLAHSHPKLADMSPAHMAHTNWKFVEQLLKECKTRTKRMLVQKMGSEAIELGHGEGSLVGVEENTLIASLCDLLERIWGHGLQRKQGKSALWSHLLNYQEGLEESFDGDNSLNPNFLSPAMAWGILRKRIDHLSSRALEMESAPSSPTHTTSPRTLPGRSRSVERTSEKSSSYSDWRSPRGHDQSGMNPAIHPLPESVSFDMKNVLSMPEIKTQIGYARAWVRLSLEKKLLSRHLNELLSNAELLRGLYKRYAFLRCEDEKEQFLSYLLSLNAVDYFCFTNKYNSSLFPYRVIIFTSRKLNAATTSASAWVSIGGTLGHTAAIPVPRSQYEMTFQHKNLGLLTTLCIGHDNSGISPKWMVENVLVRNEVSGHTWKFPCGRWLGRGIDDGSLERILVGELVPSHVTSEDLVETCRTPPRCRSPNIPGPRRSDSKLSPPQIQQLLGDAVNSIVKYFYKPERERGSLTLLLCGDLGLVYCLEMVFSYGFKSTRLFGKNLYLWDYFEKVKNQFESALREELERQQLSGLVKDDRTQGFAIMAKFIKLISRINNSSAQLGKDDKFQLFICIAARDHLLHRLLLPLQRSSVTSQMYDESAFLRDPLLVRDLINVLSALSDFEFTLEKTLTRGIEA